MKQGLRLIPPVVGRPVPRRIMRPLQAFLHTELASGLVLLVAALAALVWANSAVGESYEAFWHIELGIGVGGFVLVEDLRHWVNDLLMALFFFVVGLEIKREIVEGELADPRAALLPLVAAAGGMVVPALVYLAFNSGGPGQNGWGIPMATDIAFALGVLALVGRRAPLGLKVFLLALAIVDDIGAILVIALFYSGGVDLRWLGLAVVALFGLAALIRLSVRSLFPYVVGAGIVWLAVFESGVHATIAGVALGLLTPARPFHRTDVALEVVGEQAQRLHGQLSDEDYDEQNLLEISRVSREAVSPLARLERSLHPWTAFFVLPVFALANAGVQVSLAGLRAVLTEPITLGVVFGLLVGKPLGVFAASWLAVRTGRVRLPPGVGWLELLGVGLLAGIGFTVALFISALAFVDPAAQDAAKVGILVGSLVAAVLGAAFLALRQAKEPT